MKCLSNLLHPITYYNWACWDFISFRKHLYLLKTGGNWQKLQPIISINRKNLWIIK